MMRSLARQCGDIAGCGLGQQWQVAEATLLRSADVFEIVGRHLSALAIGYELEADLLTFDEIAPAGALDGADVDKRIVAAAIGRDEAEALGRVKPLHGSGCHAGVLFTRKIRLPAGAGRRNRVSGKKIESLPTNRFVQGRVVCPFTDAIEMEWI
jgi:hypothetical protein